MPVRPTTFRPLTPSNKFGYAVGDFACNLYWKGFELYLFSYYTDVVGLGAATVGTVLLGARVLDALSDPLVGALADRTRSRAGRFRPYLLWFSAPLALFWWFTFRAPPSGLSAVPWAVLTFGASMLGYSLVNIPYSALMAAMTRDSLERTRLASLRFAAAFLGAVTVASCTLPLVERLGHGDPARGFERVSLLTGGVATVLLLTTFVTTREADAPGHHRSSLRSDLRDLRANRAWFALLWMGLTAIVTLALRNGAAAYYLTYYVNRPELLSAYLTLGMVCQALGSLCTPVLARRWSKRALYVGVMGTGAALSALLALVPAAHLGTIFALQAATSFVLGPKSPIVWALYADAADDSERRTGRAATGLSFAAATFSVKAGAGLASFVLGWLLAALDYTPHTRQTRGAELAIVMLVSVAPACFALLSAWAVRLYPRSDPHPADALGALPCR